jgi:hypothetical protein
MLLSNLFSSLAISRTNSSLSEIECSNRPLLRDLSSFFSAQKPVLISDHGVSFKKIFFGLRAEEVINALGTPLHISIQHEANINYEILWYTEVIDNQKATIQIHLLDEIFIAATYIFDELSHKEACKCIEPLLHEQYFNSKNAWKKHSLSEFCVQDKYENIVYKSDDAKYPAVWFVAGDKRLRRKAESVHTYKPSVRGVLNALLLGVASTLLP